MNVDRNHQLELEILASMLLKVLEDHNDPELTDEALSPSPDKNKIAQHLIRLNDQKRAQLTLKRGQPAQDAAPPLDSRARRVNALLGKFK